MQRLAIARRSVLQIQNGISVAHEFVRHRNAPSGIRTLVIAVRGQYDWPDYTNGAHMPFTTDRVRLTVRAYSVVAVA